MRSGAWAMIVGAACLAGCGDGRAPPLVTPRSGGGGTTSDVLVVADTRTAMQRACPAGATLRLQVWDVYAMPSKPNEDPWDTPSRSLREFGCRVTGQVVASRLAASLSGPIAVAGVAIEDRVRGLFAEAVSSACSVSINWLLDPWEGPEIYTVLTQGNQERWRSVVTSPDRWATHVEYDSAGRGAFVAAPCEQLTVTSTLTVMDEDLINDDLLANVGIPLERIRPETICGGWALQTPLEGVAAILYRVEVDGSGQDCSGLSPVTFEDITLNDGRRGGGSGASRESRGSSLLDSEVRGE